VLVRLMSGVCGGQLRAFASGLAPLLSFPELILEVLYIALCPTVTRRVEGVHSIVKQGKKKKTNASVPHLSMRLRHHLLEAWLDKPMTTNWISKLWSRKQVFLPTLRFAYPSKSFFALRLLPDSKVRRLWFQVDIGVQYDLKDSLRQGLVRWRKHAEPTRKAAVRPVSVADALLVAFSKQKLEERGDDTVWSLPAEVFAAATVGTSAVSGSASTRNIIVSSSR